MKRGYTTTLMEWLELTGNCHVRLKKHLRGGLAVVGHAQQCRDFEHGT